ncbi:F-box/kelch-repeat protein SKIP30 [Brassica napus]|nr:F-box/kelch-repeat protein SKIP30 [Brassica napus]
MCSFRDRTDQPTRVIIKEKTNQPYRQRQKRPKFKQVRTGPNKPHYFIRFLTADTDSIVALTQNPPKKPLSLRNHPLTRIINLPVNTRTPPHRRNKPIKNFGSPRPDFTMSSLLEGIPEAVALRCLAHVPLHHHPNLELVSRSWRSATRSHELFQVRNELQSSENLLCVCAFEPENTWQVYSPNCNRWLTLPLLPSPIRHLAHFGAVATSGKLFVLGGGSDAVDPLTGDHGGTFATDEVWCYDFVKRRWGPRAPMLVPRSMFACCVLEGKIVVAGGFTTCRKSISGAEVYDPESDVWSSIPDLHRTHNSACSGLVVKGKVHVLHKGLSTTVQVLESVKLGWDVKEYGWPQGPMTVVEGVSYVLSHGVVYKQGGGDETWKMIASASEFKPRIGMAMTSLSGEVLLVGGVIGPDRDNWDIKQMSEVDVLTVGSDRPVWRKVAPMTKCRGTVLGCTQLTM